MPTRNIVPRATGEGNIGTSSKKWLAGNFGTVNTTALNSTTATFAASSGFDSLGNVTATNLGTASSKAVPASGNASSTQVVLGSDTRLSDSRTPTAHTHTKSQITDFPALATVATSGSFADLLNKPTASSLNAVAIDSTYTGVSTIAKLSQAQYDALGTKVATTLYLIV